MCTSVSVRLPPSVSSPKPVIPEDMTCEHSMGAFLRQPRSATAHGCNNSFTWRCILRKYSSRAEANDETLLLGVSRNGFAVDGFDVRLTPEDIVAAFGA